MIITTHYITGNWQTANPVLQTLAVYKSHISDCLLGILKEAVIDWKIRRSNVPVPVTTDNTKNIANTVEAAGFALRIQCLAHTVNLVAQRGMGIHQTS